MISNVKIYLNVRYYAGCFDSVGELLKIEHKNTINQ